MTLVIVESPTKARTLSRYLGGEYQVLATYGHVRDLPEKKIGIKVKEADGDFSFEPEYVMLPKQKEKVTELQKAVAKSKVVLMATDPDREGEAIAWHTAELIQGSKVKDQSLKRIVFHEITQQAIEKAIASPGVIDMQLVDAQQARRVMDRLVGYKLSPVLWKKVRRGSSAGRVQSVAVRLVVEREREIEAFKPVEYWNLQVTLQKLTIDNGQLTVKLAELNGEKIEVGNGEQAQKIEVDLRGAKYEVEKVDEKEFKRTPPAPFTTSVLQQTAANRLGWSAKKTMQVAQMLYEGGHITYHRTDSTNIAEEASAQCSVLIVKLFGKEYALEKPRVYKTKSKIAQEAHEAIRPTDVSAQYIELSALTNKDQAKLYEVIWKRFVASQMAEARGVTVTVSVRGKTEKDAYGLVVKGETISFDGWTKLYEKKNGGDVEENDNGELKQLPKLVEGEELKFVDLLSEQKFTQPPARYNDASLIKALEERGIGRPSTYAPTLSTIQDRQYVERVDKRFQPTALGIAVHDFLMTNFPKILDLDFTAHMENQLDDIAAGERMWQAVVSEFYGPFEKSLKTAIDSAERVKVEVELTGDKCPKCSEGDVVIRTGRFGKFLACSRFPDCDYKESFVEKINMACPKCTEGQVIVKRTKSRKTFYGCSNYPNCDWASWTKPKLPV